jgi:hypothetical protein
MDLGERSKSVFSAPGIGIGQRTWIPTPDVRLLGNRDW